MEYLRDLLVDVVRIGLCCLSSLCFTWFVFYFQFLWLLCRK